MQLRGYLPSSCESRLSSSYSPLGDPKLDDLHPLLIERFKRDRAAARATTNRALTMLKHLCHLAVQWGWMSSTKAQLIRSVKLMREPAGRVRYLTADEQERLAKSLPVGIRPLVVTALMSGMRLGEIVTLRKSAVDLPGRLVTLVRTKSNKETHKMVST